MPEQRFIDRNGYVCVYQPSHPRSSTRGYVPEHILVAEQALGKSLPPKAVVHHVDDNPGNNESGTWNEDPVQLIICEDQAYHMLLHARKRRLEDTGSFGLKRCGLCNEAKPLAAFSKRTTQGWDGCHPYCKDCDKAKAHHIYHNVIRPRIEAAFVRKLAAEYQDFVPPPRSVPVPEPALE